MLNAWKRAAVSNFRQSKEEPTMPNRMHTTTACLFALILASLAGAQEVATPVPGQEKVFRVTGQVEPTSAPPHVEGAYLQGSASDLVTELLSRIAMRLLSGNETKLLAENRTKAMADNHVKIFSDVHLHLFSGNSFEFSGNTSEIDEVEVEGVIEDGAGRWHAEEEEDEHEEDEHEEDEHEEDEPGESVVGASASETSDFRPASIAGLAARLASTGQQESPDDLDQIQGLWERSERVGLLATRRVTKEIEGNRETVTYYTPNGQVESAQQVTISVRRAGPVRIFSYGQMKYTAGPQAGTASDQQAEYLYKIVDDKFVEMWGVLEPDRDTVNVLVWQRAADA
jgi:hypothetical protein